MSRIAKISNLLISLIVTTSSLFYLLNQEQSLALINKIEAPPTLRPSPQRIAQGEQGYVTLDSTGNNNEANELLVRSFCERDKQIRFLTSQVQEVDARNQSLNILTNAGSINSTYKSVEAGQDEDLQALGKNVRELESQVAASRTALTDNHPEVIRLTQELSAARTLYNRRLSQLGGGTIGDVSPESAQVGQDLSLQLIQGKILRLSLQKSLEATLSSLNQIEGRRQQFPVIEQWFTQMDRRRQAFLKSTQLLERKLDEVGVSEAQLLSNLSIVSLADSSKKNSSKNIPAEENAETIRAEAKSAREFLEGQILQRRLELLQIEARMSKFKQEYCYEVSVEMYSELENQRRSLECQIEKVDDRNQLLSALINDGSINSTGKSVKTGQETDSRKCQD